MDGRKRKTDAYRKSGSSSPSEEPVRPPRLAAGPEAEGKKRAAGDSPGAKKPGFIRKGRDPTGAGPAAAGGRPGKDSTGSTGSGAGGPGLLKITGRETSVRKAAKFLVLIGPEEAGKVLRLLSEEEIEALTREVAGIRGVQAAEAEKLLEEFGFLKETLRYPVGGVEAARRILVGAFGEERGREFLRRSLPADQEKFFSYLEDYGDNQLFHLLRSESPQVLAVILPYLSPPKASALLTLFDSSYRLELVSRMARKEKVQREILEKMDEALREKTRRLASPQQEDQEVDGAGILAEILKFVDYSQEEEILRNLEAENPLVAEEIKDRLFTMDVLDYMRDEDLRKLLQGMADRDIALLLKGKGDHIRGRVLSCISERRRGFVAEEYRILGPVPKKEVDAATKDFLALLRKLEEEGSIVFFRERDTWVD